MEESEKTSFEIGILGQNVRIRHEDEKYVRKLEKFINKRLESVQKGSNVTSLHAAVRVLLVLADEYFSVKKKQEDDLRYVDDRARRMIELIAKSATM